MFFIFGGRRPFTGLGWLWGYESQKLGWCCFAERLDNIRGYQCVIAIFCLINLPAFLLDRISQLRHSGPLSTSHDRPTCSHNLASPGCAYDPANRELTFPSPISILSFTTVATTSFGPLPSPSHPFPEFPSELHPAPVFYLIHRLTRRWTSRRRVFG